MSKGRYKAVDEAMRGAEQKTAYLREPTPPPSVEQLTARKPVTAPSIAAPWYESSEELARQLSAASDVRASFPIEKGIELLDPTGKRDPQLDRLEIGDSVLVTDRAPTTVRNMVLRVGRRLGKKYVTRRAVDSSGKYLGIRIHRTE